MLVQLFIAWTAVISAGASQIPLASLVPSTTQWIYDTNVKVPVVLGVMSRCPDAILCESVFDQVLKEVADKVDLSLTFIGR